MDVEVKNGGSYIFKNVCSITGYHIISYHPSFIRHSNWLVAPLLMIRTDDKDDIYFDGYSLEIRRWRWLDYVSHEEYEKEIRKGMTRCYIIKSLFFKYFVSPIMNKLRCYRLTRKYSKLKS